jgi:hypothetical protein
MVRHRAEPFVPEPNVYDFEIAIGKLKWYWSPEVDKIPAELIPAGLIPAGGETLHSKVRKLVKVVWNKEELPFQ